MANSWKTPQDYTNKVPSSAFNLSNMFSSTMFQGLNYPIKFEKVRIGDRWSIDMADLLQSDPMLGPLKGSFRLTLSVWFESDFNLYGWMRDNDQQSTSVILTNNRHSFKLPLFPQLSTQRYLVFDTSDEKLSDLAPGDIIQPAAGLVREAMISGLKDLRDPSVFGPAIVNSGRTVIKGGAVARGSLLDYAGFAPGYQGNPATQDDLDTSGLNSYCADFLLAYLDIMRCGFTNTQTRIDDARSTSFIPVVGNRLSLDYYYNSPSTPDYGLRNIFYDMPLSDLDGFFKWLRAQEDGVDFDINSYLLDPATQNLDWSRNPYTYGSDEYWKFFFQKYVCISLLPHGGLFAAQYRPDVYRNLLSTDVGKVNSQVSVQNGVFSIDVLRFQNKLQRVIDRYDISGGRISSWLRTLWGVETRRNFATPELLGVMSHVLDARTITAVSQTGEIGGSDSTDVGAMRANFDDMRQHKRISFVATEPGTLVVIAQLVPIVSYCQNIRPELREVSFADEYNPEFAQLGYQDVPLSDYSVLPDSKDVDWEADDVSAETFGFSDNWMNDPFYLETSVGRNVAWVHLMTSTNRCHGEYSTLGSRDYWTLQRRYTRFFERSNRLPIISNNGDGSYTYKGLQDIPALGASTYISPYVDPLDFQYMFADQTLLDPHWHLDVWFDCKVVRKLPKRFMPNLERND